MGEGELKERMDKGQKKYLNIVTSIEIMHFLNEDGIF